MLKKIKRHCEYCQSYGGKPQRFKFTLRNDSISFNHSIHCDVLIIAKTPVLHVVDESTRFRAANQLAKMTEEEPWKELKRCWINVYLGPPDIITHDAGSNFVARFFQQKTDLLHINCQEVPIEAANRMSLVERYHAPLRRAFITIRKEFPTFSFDDAVLAAVKSLNDSTGPDGIMPTLLVFGTMP